MSYTALLIGLVLLTATSLAADVPFVFDGSSSGVAGYSADQLESLRASSPDLAGVPAVTTPSDNEVLQFTVTGGGSTPLNTTEKNADDLKKALDARVEPDNSRVRDEAVVLALKYPGEKTIEQIASIYNYLKNGDGSKKGWGYVSDPRGIDYFMFANQTLKNGDKANCVGGGDCDDFAILMSALVESVGGTTRIILARNSSIGGHAYTEVYLGNLSEQNNQVEGIIDWLKEKSDTDKIYTHIDTDTKDVWLNLDWGPDEKGNTHPGGPFYQGDKHIVLCIRDRYEKTALKLSETSRYGNKHGTIVPKQTILDEIYSTTDPNYQDINGLTIREAFTKHPELAWDESVLCEARAEGLIDPSRNEDKQNPIYSSVTVSLEGRSEVVTPTAEMAADLNTPVHAEGFPWLKWKWQAIMDSTFGVTYGTVSSRGYNPRAEVIACTKYGLLLQ
ncbi:MAG: transglutaminase-like domain-containing protein [Methanothrix sp.]